MPTRKTPRDVYGDNIIADIADFFLIDEPSDALKFLPGGGVKRGAGVISNVMKESNSPSANMVRKMFGGAKGLTNDITALFKGLSRGMDNIPPAPKAKPFDPRDSKDMIEMMKRRLTEENKDSILRTAVTSAALGEGTRKAGRGAFDSLMKFIDDEIESERQRTGGRGLF